MAEIQDALGIRAEATATLQTLVNDYSTTYQAIQAQRKLTEWGWTSGKEETPKKQEGRYTVQVGAFSKRANASNLEAKLRSWGYQVEVVKRAGRHRTLYFVWVGSYGTREDALREARILENDRGLPYQIILR
jgi:cell division protein FtsN